MLIFEKKLPDIGDNKKTFLEYLRVHTLFMRTRKYFLCFLLSDLLMEFYFLSLWTPYLSMKPGFNKYNGIFNNS